MRAPNPVSEPEGAATSAAGTFKSPSASIVPTVEAPPGPPAATERLFRSLCFLALPVLAENFLNIIVGLNDAYLANHLPADINVDGAAAVGTVVYLLWFLGLFAGALGTGATAIISRAIGARHKARAHACCGQALLLGLALGSVLGLFFLFGAELIAKAADLKGNAGPLAAGYLRIMSIGAPFFIVLLVANACLRGAGDTRTPFLAMLVVNTVNVAATWTLTFGYLGFQPMGVNGIAIGTVIAYAVGALMQVGVLLTGLGKLRVRYHRLQFHRVEMARLLRLGIPSAAENALMWGVNFFIVRAVNQLGPAASAAHLNTIRIEALSYMTGFAFGVATATMVGQSLGMKNPDRARKVARYGYFLAGAVMAAMGFVFIFGGHLLADIMSEDPSVRDLTAMCLRITGFTQWSFAGAIVFSSALRGAGDVRSMLAINIISLAGVRLCGVYIVTHYFNAGLGLIWIILGSEMTFRAGLCLYRFRSGAWQKTRV